MESVFKIFAAGKENIFSGEQQIISLKFISINALDGLFCPFHPFFLGFRMLVHNTKFSVQKPDSLPNRYQIACYRIISANKIRCFSTSYFQTI